MNLRRLLGVALLVLGTLALVYRTFSVPTERHTAKIGSLELDRPEQDGELAHVKLASGSTARMCAR